LPALDRGRELGRRLLVRDDGIFHLGLLEPGLLGELEHLLLLDLVRKRREVRQVPVDELLRPLRVALPDPPPRPRRRHAGGAGQLQDVTSIHRAHAGSPL
jgi:hypothetical protein